MSFVSWILCFAVLLLEIQSDHTGQNYYDKLGEVVDLDDPKEVREFKRWFKLNLKRKSTGNAELNLFDGGGLSTPAQGELPVTYSITRLSRDLEETEIRKYVGQAFDIWQTDRVKQYLTENGCPVLTLRPSEEGGQDLSVMFDTTLFKKYPEIAAFDSVWHSKKKTIYVNDNKDLTREIIVPSIAHEIGHYLGLRHEYGRYDLMNPSYKNVELSDTDLKALRESLQCDDVLY